jgi:hypothetical protein
MKRVRALDLGTKWLWTMKISEWNSDVARRISDDKPLWIIIDYDEDKNIDEDLERISREGTRVIEIKVTGTGASVRSYHREHKIGGSGWTVDKLDKASVKLIICWSRGTISG